jgi:hypothetical protein
LDKGKGWGRDFLENQAEGYQGEQEVVAKSIIETLERNRGRFPPSGNLFLELERNEEDP